MEKRKAYIITALIIILALTGLAFWYLYTARQELTIGQTTDLELYGIGDDAGHSSNVNDQGNFNNKPTTTPNNPSQVTQQNNSELQKDQDIPIIEPESWRLVQISNEPSVGASSNDGMIQFTDQKTGNIYTSNKGSTRERVSGTILKQVRNSYTMSDDSVLIITNNTTPKRASLEEPEPTITTTDFLDDMLQIAQSGDYLYYTTPNNTGGINVKSTKDTQVVLWSSHLRGWLLQVIDDYIIITQKASYNIPGYAYIIPKQGIDDNTIPKTIAQDLPGLITNLSQDATQLLYSTSDNEGTKLFLKKLNTGDIIPLSIKTLASKCAWSNNNITLYCAVPHTIPSNMPDDWYKGKVHFTDSLWRINTTTGDAYELAQNTGLDILEIVEDTSGGVVIFKNKTDQSLWAIIKN